MSTFMYKDKPLAEPGNVDFGSSDISGIGDGTVTGAINALDSINTWKLVGEITSAGGGINLPEKWNELNLYVSASKSGKYGWECVSIHIDRARFDANSSQYISASGKDIVALIWINRDGNGLALDSNSTNAQYVEVFYR